jgi:rhodanese-related sulfurtransferase
MASYRQSYPVSHRQQRRRYDEYTISRLGRMTEIPTVDLSGVPEPIPAGVIVLDVREPDEYAAGHLSASLHIPLADLPARLASIPVDQQVLVVCKVGSRSAYATAFLQSQGIDATNLAGGLMAWESAGRPLVADNGTVGFVA